MNAGASKVSLSFRLSGILLIMGLCVEAISLNWIHPIAFLTFFVVGGVFLAAGVLLYLSSIVFQHSPTNPNDSPEH
jgi:hypothetical protein